MNSKKKQQRSEIKEGLIELFLNLIIVVLLVGIIRTFIVSPFQVSGPSMCNTMNVINNECVESADTIGEFIIINKFIYYFTKPKRGDIIIFKKEDSPHHYIKRVIATGGDIIHITDGDVFLTPVGGEKVLLEEPYLNMNDFEGTHPPGLPITVPEDRYYVMGDNRHHSSDSRMCFGYNACRDVTESPFVKPHEINGKAMVTLWPLQNMRVIEHHKYDFDSMEAQ